MNILFSLTALLVLATLLSTDAHPLTTKRDLAKTLLQRLKTHRISKKRLRSTKQSIPGAPDTPSSHSCFLYNNIKARGNKICTDRCRSFTISNRLGFEYAYLSNAFCACDVTPKYVTSARTVRRCLQQRLIDASRRGKTAWSVADVGLWPHWLNDNRVFHSS